MPDPIVTAGLISAGANIIGGLFGRKSESQANAFNRELNQNKISWTVADAKRAGVHPLAALGSPAAGSWAQQTASNPMGDAISSAGSAYAQARQTKAERDLAQASHALALQRQAKQNDLIDAQIANMRASTYATYANAGPRFEDPNLVPTGTGDQPSIFGLPGFRALFPSVSGAERYDEANQILGWGNLGYDLSRIAQDYHPMFGIPRRLGSYLAGKALERGSSSSNRNKRSGRKRGY